MAVEIPPKAPAKDMLWITGGSFQMGSDDFYPEERPAHTASVTGFWMDQYLVTNAAFRRFIKATGYVTIAERPLNPNDFPTVASVLLQPGSLVFVNPGHPVDLNDFRQWWRYTPGACWQHPEGPGSTLAGRDRHPVVHIAYPDALAYATWAGKTLPTEAEWEYAARAGLQGASYVWGNELNPQGRIMANIWQGEFPWKSLKPAGEQRTSAVARFPANRFGLYDMAGNVWEWTADEFLPQHQTETACCAPERGLASQSQTMVIKGGSFLCAANYCLRYRPAARQSQTADSSTSHIGFRCIIRPHLNPAR